MTPRSIELHIEELVLHGFAPGDRYRIGEAVEQELAQGGEIVSVDDGAFEVAPGSRAEAVGAQVAKAVYGGLGR